MTTRTVLQLLRSRLLQPTLPLTCLALSGCSLFCDGYRENQNTKEDAQHAAFVLVSRSIDNYKDSQVRPIHRVEKDENGNEHVVMDFNWEKITVAGVPLSAFPKKHKAVAFTLNVYEFDSGVHIPSASITELAPIDADDRRLVGIPLDTLLRTDIRFKVKGKGDQDEYAQPTSFVLMFKKGQNLQPAPQPPTPDSK